MQRFANFISYFFSPLLVPVLAAAFVLFSGHVFTLNVLNTTAKLYLLFVLFIFMFAMPLSALLMLKSMGLAENLNLPNRRQRFVPFLLSIVFYYAAYFLLSSINGIPVILLHLLISGIILLIVATLFTLWFQISIHTMCMGSLVGMLCFLGLFYQSDAFNYVLIALVISGLVGFSRLVLNAHKPYQIYIGFLVGLMVQYFSLLGCTVFL